MTPKMALAVDPIFLHVLALLDRINRNKNPSPQEERLRIRALLDQGEALLGAGGEWELAEYALVSWIDEMLIDAQWSGREWWSNNVLEMEVFNTRLCNERFFLRAQEASRLSRRDALEVYYVCVVLGFRGFYQDPDMAPIVAETHSLPADIRTWCQQAAMSIRLGQGRLPLSAPGREIRGARPLRARAAAFWPWVAAVTLGIVNVLYFSLR